MSIATADDLTAAGAGPGAGDRLHDAVRGLATRASRPDADRLLRLAGPVLLPTGAILILLGWYGAANTTRVFLQIPYLISGGLLGLGLMFAGGFLYFARWLTDLLDETRARADAAEASAERTALALERIEQSLRDVRSGASARADVAVTVDLVATAKGSMAHRRDCRLVAGRAVHDVTFDGTLGRCQICRPPVG
ncbi:hypothetical protein [Actinospongicola halichondriae]|uniref:hypothetical protein n=1 Tax=Actinospongicola halichondriae TaxID=3236844 RepID=UPI003D57613C